MSGRAALHIRHFRSESIDGVHRAIAEVDGTPLTFESSDVALVAAPEAFVGASLVGALQQGRDLVVEAPLDARFASGVRRLVALFGRWWGYAPIEVQCEAPPVPDPDDAPLPETARRCAACFSGGVDSFYGLLHAGGAVDLMVFAQGFDIRLADRERARSFEASARDVARRLGMGAVQVRSPLRDHPISRDAPWAHAHGGALAALGHLIPGLSRLQIAASFPRAQPLPWGSRWDVDPLWSTRRTTIAHHGEALWRSEKLRKIAHHPLVMDHLRVCWEYRNAATNCSRCEKCVRTMLNLAQCGALAGNANFATDRPLPELVTELGHLAAILIPTYEEILANEKDPETRRALERLLARSGATLRARLGRGWDRLRRNFARGA